jgi:hypothetical protein
MGLKIVLIITTIICRFALIQFVTASFAGVFVIVKKLFGKREREILKIKN